MNSKKESKATILYKNWVAHSQGKPLCSTYEYPLYSDAHLTAEIIDELGPYYLLNTVPSVFEGNISPALIFRADIHLDDDPMEMNKTDVSLYHGGWLHDEMAALVSLCLGVRLKAGGMTRSFDINKDPKGRPSCHNLQETPVFIKNTYSGYRIPSALGTHCLNDAKLLISSFSKLPEKAAVILVKSARLYQDALWLAESEPELAWLLLVSSIETAAKDWSETKNTSIERLKDFNKDLYQLLESKLDQNSIKKVADILVNYMGATKKFTGFILEFFPEPPKNRSNLKYGLIEWDNNSIEKPLKIIYDWRSKALHSGIPFPAPMCEAPRLIDDGYSEKPLGLASRTGQGVWKNEDTPMLLHMFEYIVRNALLKWWSNKLNCK